MSESSNILPFKTNQDGGDLTILAINKRSWAHDRAGGAESNLEHTLKRLADRGHSVHLLAGSDGGKQRLDADESVSIRRVGIDERVSAPWDVVLAYLTISVYFYWHAYRLSPDIVYTVNSPLPWPVTTRRPRVCIFHHIAIDSFFDTHPFPQNVLGYLSQWFGVRRERSTPTVSVSPSTTEELVSRGHDPATVHEVKNGLEVSEFAPGSESETPSILYLGALDRYKGVDRLPEIHQEIEEQCDRSVDLHVAGRDGEATEAVTEYCDRTENASYHGFVSEERKLELLQSAWVFIAPSRVEGWGLAVMEANACGTPAVGSRVSGLKDSIKHEDTGLLADGDDPATFAAAVVRLIENPELRESCGADARAWSEQHSWEESTDRLEAVFYEVCDR